ncbi:hemerythrin domain-containing protein [Chitinophaga flava]|uniref:Hemerythrin n=1 Tax=Chitinophaga flava TaxID=2259036 RepID=A0A365XZ83_9BACT|nr:hemerythrin domain-containing protein [Chitinophaga flava]RBL91696.1 hemerythrin [Chitinophaga flava]
MKRSPALVPLSKDHHHGLLQCWKIRYGLSHHIPLERISAYVLFSFDNELEDHFQLEEHFVFTLLPDDHPMRVRAVRQHATLRSIVERLQHARLDGNLLHGFADELDDHIRFEEREMFPYIEKISTEEALSELEKRIDAGWRQPVAQWEDEFWLNKGGL